MRTTLQHPCVMGLFWICVLAVAAWVPSSLGSCSSSSCLNGGYASSWTLDFDSPIGQPGRYEFVAGSDTCSVELPAISSTCATIRDFSVVGLFFQSWNSRPSRQLHVRVTKDGSEVLSGDVAADSYVESSTCGQSSVNASFSMHVPTELAHPTRALCDLSNLAGTYAIVESDDSGGCSSVFITQTTALANGVLVPTDPSCQSQLISWSPDTCRAESTTTCTSTALNARWKLTLTDLLGDGTRLVGNGQVTMASPVPCEGAASLQLTRD